MLPPLLDVIIIVLESQKYEIAQRVDKLPLKMKYDFVTISSENDYGTADALRSISEKIKSDVFLISCDVVTNVDFYPVLNMFRKNDASVVSLFINGSSSSADAASITIPGPKTKHKQEKDLVGINPDNDRLLFLASTSDFEDTMALPAHLLRSHGKIVIHSGLVDAHIYLVKKWVVDYLAKCDRFSTIKGELLPFIIKKQMSKPTQSNACFSEVSFDTNDIFDHVKQGELDQRILETNLNNISRVKKSHNAELIRCYAYIAPPESFGMRVNTMLGFCIANKKVFGIWESLCGNTPMVSPTAIIKSTQMSDSAVAENTTISEKTSIKSTVFGASCVVHEKTRITDSYIMNNVVIEER